MLWGQVDPLVRLAGQHLLLDTRNKPGDGELGSPPIPGLAPDPGTAGF